MIREFLVAAVRVYRRWLSPLKPPVCRFVPSCSEYAIEALTRHGAARGSWLATRRICRCHPWGGHGYDPVPGASKLSPAADTSDVICPQEASRR